MASYLLKYDVIFVRIGYHFFSKKQKCQAKVSILFYTTDDFVHRLVAVAV